MFITTGISALDDWFGGWCRGKHHVIAGRPTMGKSLLFYHCMLGAGQAGIKTLLFTPETQSENVVRRLVGIAANVPYAHLLTGNVDADEHQRVGSAIKVIGNFPIAIDDSLPITTGSIWASTQKLKAKQGVDVIFIDNITRLAGWRPEHDTSEHRLMTDVCTELCKLAEKLNVAVVTAAYVKRDVETRADHLPQMDDLRCALAVDRGAHFVMTLHRPAHYDCRLPQTDLEVNVAKNAITGITGIRALYLDEQRFETVRETQ